MAKYRKADIAGARGSSFNVSSEVIDFMHIAEIQYMKAKSVEQSDIFLDTRDPRNTMNKPLIKDYSY